MDYFLDPNQIIDLFYSEPFTGVIYDIKIFSGIISAILFLGIVVLGVKTKKFWERALNVAKSLEAVHEIKGKEKMAKKWKEIEGRANSHIESDRKISVIEADKFIDDLFKKIGFRGRDMGERLKSINPNQISNINEIWQAHKIRNNLAHDPHFKLERSDAELVIKTYNNTLKELGVL